MVNEKEDEVNADNVTSTVIITFFTQMCQKVIKNQM